VTTSFDKYSGKKTVAFIESEPNRKTKLFLLVVISVLNEMGFRFEPKLFHVFLLCCADMVEVAVHAALKHTSLAPHFCTTESIIHSQLAAEARDIDHP
jgi:hypothetical protein